MFTEHEVTMIRTALRAQAETCRKLAKSRQYAGPTFASIRATARDRAKAFDALADSLRLSHDGRLGHLPI
jgi:hypothetical protein